MRYFAGIAEKTGKTEETFPDLVDLDDLIDRLRGAYGEAISPALEVCSFLVDGAVATDRAASLGQVTRVDVLPPFAGG